METHGELTAHMALTVGQAVSKWLGSCGRWCLLDGDGVAVARL